LIKMQTHVRGFLIRKKFYKKRKEIRIRAKRKLIPNGDVALQKLKLKDRTARAIETLKTSKRWSEILHAVKELEICTKYSLVCCKAVLGTGSHGVIVDVICSLNRSAPHIIVLESALKTLLQISNFLDLFSHMEVEFTKVLIDKIHFGTDKKVNFSALVLLERQIKHDKGNYVAGCADLMKRLRLIRDKRDKYFTPKSMHRLKYLIQKLESDQNVRMNSIL